MPKEWPIEKAKDLVTFSQVNGDLIPYDNPNFVISIALQSGVNYLDLTKPCEEKGQTLYFRSLGTENKPFAGTIKAADNKTVPIHLDKALFNYLSTSADIGGTIQLVSKMTDTTSKNLLADTETDPHTLTINDLASTAVDGYTSYTIASMTDFAKVALRVQLNEAGRMKIPNDVTKDGDVKIVLNNDISLPGTGLNALTRDVDNETQDGGIHGRVGGSDGHHGDAANKPHQAQHRQIPHPGHGANHRGFQIENPAHFTLTAFSCASTPSSAALKQWAWVMAFSVRFMQSRIS